MRDIKGPSKKSIDELQLQSVLFNVLLLGAAAAACFFNRALVSDDAIATRIYSNTKQVVSVYCSSWERLKEGQR
jgi:hypothetical protein